MKPALLVIDIQKAFFSQTPEAGPSLRQAIPVVNGAISLFREKTLPVICIQHINPLTGVTPETEGFAIPDDLAITSTDMHIHKRYGNAFNKTDLEQVLREQGVDTLILTGYCAEFCVLSTYRGALDRDLTPVLLKGGLASRNPGNIPFVENISELITLGTLKQLLS